MFELPRPDAFARALGVPCALAAAEKPCSLADLSPGEREQCRALAGPRRESWLRGRAAWKELLVRTGEAPDSARFALPSARFSLTHSRGLSLAAGLAPEHALGLGIDLERGRTPRPDAARFFLTEAERSALSYLGGGALASALQRLWTVKEALFKAHPHNRGRLLCDYCVADALASAGDARAPDGLPLCYASLPVPAGFLTIALLPSARILHASAARERALAAQLL